MIMNPITLHNSIKPAGFHRGVGQIWRRCRRPNRWLDWIMHLFKVFYWTAFVRVMTISNIAQKPTFSPAMELRVAETSCGAVECSSSRLRQSTDASRSRDKTRTPFGVPLKTFLAVTLTCVLSLLPSPAQSRNWSIEELMSQRFPYQTSNDLYLDVCKAGESHIMVWLGFTTVMPGV